MAMVPWKEATLAVSVVSSCTLRDIEYRLLLKANDESGFAEVSSREYLFSCRRLLEYIS